MPTSTETFATTGKTAFETSFNVARTLFESIERMTALNLNTARTFFEDGTAAIRGALAAKNPKDLLALQTSLAQPTAEKAVAYYRGVFEILAQTLEEAMKPFEIQFSEVNKSFGVALENAAKSAPAGSEVAIAAVRSAIATANSAYDQVNKAARHVVELTETNVANAAATATAAISAAASKSTI
jgi:phasin family protein